MLSIFTIRLKLIFFKIHFGYSFRLSSKSQLTCCQYANSINNTGLLRHRHLMDMFRLIIPSPPWFSEVSFSLWHNSMSILETSQYLYFEHFIFIFLFNPKPSHLAVKGRYNHSLIYSEVIDTTEQ